MSIFARLPIRWAATGLVLASDATVLLARDVGFAFEDRGSHELRGIEGSRHLFRVG